MPLLPDALRKTVLDAVAPQAEVPRLKSGTLARDPDAFHTVLVPRESTGDLHPARPE